MRVLVTGAGGQVGQELHRLRPAAIDLVAPFRDDLDIRDERAVLDMARTVKPDVIVNAAAYTDVDGAESDAEAAFAVNSTGTLNLAVAAKEVGSRLVHISSDFVFGGEESRPYRPDDSPHPLSVYGRSKLDGEEAIRSRLENAVILRSSWVYSRFGSNFVNTMLRLMRERPKLGVVCDQIGVPTWARGLAATLWEIVHTPSLSGIYHWTDAGVASWYDLAVATQEIALERGILTSEIPVEPITTEAFPTPARRPRYSVLDSSALVQATGLQQEHWRRALGKMLRELEEADDA